MAMNAMGYVVYPGNHLKYYVKGFKKPFGGNFITFLLYHMMDSWLIQKIAYYLLFIEK